MKTRTLVLIAILGPAVVGAAGGAWPNGSRLFGLGG
jgi:hypothetical protein